MKMNKKGFTLVELLAVIVILAIIALIATPIILGVIDNARKNSAKDAAYGVIDTVKLNYVETLYSNGNVSVAYTGNVTDSVIADKISGSKPTSGTWSINSSTSEVSITDVVFGEYKCSGTGAGVTCNRTTNS